MSVVLRFWVSGLNKLIYEWSDYVFMCIDSWIVHINGFQVALIVKNLPANSGGMRDSGMISGLIPWRKAWQSTPVFLLGESHGLRSLAGYSPWGHKETDMTEATSQNNSESMYLWFPGNSEHLPSFYWLEKLWQSVTMLSENTLILVASYSSIKYIFSSST